MAEVRAETLKFGEFNLYNAFSFHWLKAKDVAFQHGIDLYEPENTSASDTATVTEMVEVPINTASDERKGLVSLLGKYNDDPTWEDFPVWLKEYRHQIDESSK